MVGLAAAMGCGGGGKSDPLPTGKAAGTVVLPPGVGVPASSLTVVGSLGTGAVADDGSFTLTGFTGGAQLVLVLSPAGNPMLAGFVDAQHTTIDASTTAGVAVYFSAGVQALPDDARKQALALIPGEAGLAPIASAIATALVANVDAFVAPNAEVAVALNQELDALMFNPNLFALAITPGRQSGVDLIQDPPFAFHVTNNFRRRAWAFVDRTTYVDNTGAEVMAAAWSGGFEVPPINGLQGGVFGTLTDMINAYYGNQATTYAPVNAPAPPDKSPFEVALIGDTKTNYMVTLVGPGGMPGAVAALDATQLSRLATISLTGFAKDAFFPVMINIVIGSGVLPNQFATALTEALVADFIGVVPQVPGLQEQITSGQWRAAWNTLTNDATASNSLRTFFVDDFNRLAPGFGVRAIAAGVVFSKFNVLINAFSAAGQAFDSYLYRLHLGNSNLADQWSIAVTPSKVALNPSTSTVTVGDMKQLTTSVLSVDNLTGYSFRWHNTGRGGTLIQVGAGSQSGNDIACASGPSVNYLAATSGVTDTVTVEVWPPLANCQGQSLGTAPATVMVVNSGGGGCPAGSQLTVSYSGMTIVATRLCVLDLRTPFLEINAAFEPASPGGNTRTLDLCAGVNEGPGTHPLLRRCQPSRHETVFGAAGSPGLFNLCGSGVSGGPSDVMTVTAVGANKGDPVIGSFAAHLCDIADPSVTLDITGTFNLPRLP